MLRNVEEQICQRESKFEGMAKVNKDHYETEIKTYTPRDFPGGAVVKNLSASAGDTNPGPGRSYIPQSN